MLQSQCYCDQHYLVHSYTLLLFKNINLKLLGSYRKLLRPFLFDRRPTRRLASVTPNFTRDVVQVYCNSSSRRGTSNEYVYRTRYPVSAYACICLQEDPENDGFELERKEQNFSSGSIAVLS